MIYEDALLISKKTGEVVKDYSGNVIYVQTKEQREQTKKYVEKDKLKKTGEIKYAPDEKYEGQGSFIWNIHDNVKTLFPEVREASLTRLMFLATFLCYDGYLKDGRDPIVRTMFPEYLKISEREYYRFWKEMTTSELMYEQNNRVYLNPKIFVKGSIEKSTIRYFAIQEKYITRIYIAAVRELYNSATAQSVKSLGYLFRILPYVNREYNICCFDPLETNIDYLEPMTLGEFADIIGYDRSKTNRLAKTLHKPKFNVNGEQKNAMRYVAANSTDAEAYGMFINPRVYYAGSDWNKVEVLCGF